MKLIQGFKSFKNCQSILDKKVGARICLRDKGNIFLASRILPSGVFYRTGLVTAEFQPLVEDTMGITYFNQRPFRIVLNSRITDGRLEVTLVHEMLHVYSEVYKIPLRHQDLHTLSVFMLTDILPAINAAGLTS